MNLQPAEPGGGQTGTASPGTTAGNPSSGVQEVTAANGNGTDRAEENGPSEEETENPGQQEETGYFRPSVTIQMEDTTILTTEKMQMAKEQNFDLLLDMGGAVAWSIDVDSIDEAAMAEVDMGVTLGTNNVPQELISTILGGNKYLEITLAHQGEFGFEPVLNVALGKEYSGKYANLFYYDPEAETLEFICDAIIDSEGVASLRFEHASCYLIIVSDESMSGVSFENETVNSVTRWIVVGAFICMLLVVAGYGIFFFLKKRREEDDEENGDEEDDENDEEYGDDEDDEERDEEEDEIAEDEPYEGYESEEVDESYEEYEEEGNKPYSYEENEKPVRHFQTFDLKSVEADKGHERGNDEYCDEDDWIEDEDWQEPEADAKSFRSVSTETSAEDEWLDDEGNAEDDWIEDDEWRE